MGDARSHEMKTNLNFGVRNKFARAAKLRTRVSYSHITESFLQFFGYRLTRPVFPNSKDIVT